MTQEKIADITLQSALQETLRTLLGVEAGREAYCAGLPQRSGTMTVVPVFGPERTDIALPSVGAALSRVRTYGSVDLTNSDRQKIGIAPLHMGFIQKGAQNHALCRSLLLGPGETVPLDDACCVQAAQGGYLAGGEQRWFFVLPLALRSRALQLRHQKGYNKLWTDIAVYNRTMGLDARGHLEQILTRKRAYLTQYQSRFEREESQIGALFFLEERLAGIELAPSAEYFREIWMPLVCFGYGVAAMQIETAAPTPEEPPFTATSLAELRSELERSRRERDCQVAGWLRSAARYGGAIKRQKPEARRGNLQLRTVEGAPVAGQIVHDGGQIVYASLFAVGK